MTNMKSNEETNENRETPEVVERVPLLDPFPPLGGEDGGERERLPHVPEVQGVRGDGPLVGRPVSPNEVTLPPRYDLAPIPPESKELTKRPRKFTHQTKRKILVALKMGHTPATAASHAGITRKTLLNWWAQGQMAGPDSEGVDLELYEFSDLCIQARAGGKMGLVAICWRHAREDGKVAIQLLEKLFPEDYGKQTTHKVTGKVEHEHGVKKVDYSGFTDEELDQAESLALKAQRERAKEEAIDAEILE